MSRVLNARRHLEIITSVSQGPKRLAFCITELDPGGAERAMLQIARRLDRTRWEPAVYCLFGRGALTIEFEALGIPVRFLAARGRLDLPVILRLRNALRSWRPEILQCFLHHANIAGRIAGRLARVPHIVCGIRVAERRHRWRLQLDRLTQSLVTRHVCVSRAVAEFAVNRAGLDPHRIVVIPNGVEFSVWRDAQAADLNDFGIPAGSQVVLCVGRLDRQKRPFHLLEAVGPLFDRFARLHLLFVGDGGLAAELKRRIANQNLAGRVHFAGRSDHVPALMKAATCLVLASEWEGMPNVVLEAMASGLPVVATDVEGVGELIQNGHSGIVVDPSSIGELRAAIARIASDSEAARIMAVRSQHFAYKEFTWDSVAQKYDALFNELLNCDAFHDRDSSTDANC